MVNIEQMDVLDPTNLPTTYDILVLSISTESFRWKLVPTKTSPDLSNIPCEFSFLYHVQCRACLTQRAPAVDEDHIEPKHQYGLVKSIDTELTYEAKYQTAQTIVAVAWTI